MRGLRLFANVSGVAKSGNIADYKKYFKLDCRVGFCNLPRKDASSSRERRDPDVVIHSGLWAVLGIVYALSGAHDAVAGGEVKPYSSAPATFADMVAPLIPAVVNISTNSKLKPASALSSEDMPFPKGSPFDELFREFFDKAQPEGMRNVTSLGSGFVIDPKGYIVTNNHVIDGAEEITVTLDDNTELPAKVVGRDRRTDIAVLKVETDKPLASVSWSDQDHLRVGDWIVAIGNPFGLGSTVTSGIVSHQKRDISARPGQPGSSDFVDGYIQTDASINLGNSGGPMFDMGGKVVGVNTAIYSPTGGNVGIGFAIPSSIARSVVDQIMAYGRTKRGWLGVKIQGINEDIADSLGMKKIEGALVGSVVANGPAVGKIQAGDVILKVGSQTVKDARSLPRLVGNLNVGTDIPLTLWRKGKLVASSIKVGEYEEAEASGVIKVAEVEEPADRPSGVDVEGMKLQAVTTDLAKQFKHMKAGEGVVISDVDLDSAAAQKGLRPGDVILEISQEKVASPAEISQKIGDAKTQGRKSVLLLVNRDGETRYVSVKIGA